MTQYRKTSLWIVLWFVVAAMALGALLLALPNHADAAGNDPDFAIPGRPVAIVIAWDDHETTDLVESYVILRSRDDPVVTMDDAISTVTRAETFVSTGTLGSHHEWRDIDVVPGTAYYYRAVYFRHGVYSVVSSISAIRSKGYRPPRPPFAFEEAR